VLKEGVPIGWFDGVAQVRGQISGAGGVIKINSHTEYRWMLNCGPGTNTRAEFLGVWALLTLASRLHLQDLQVFGDSKIVIDWLNHKCVLQVLNLECWKDQIKDLYKDFRTLIFSHIYKEYNQQSDELSKRAPQHQEGKIIYNQMEDGHMGPTLFLNLL
jgi:ribonuclease HI